MNSRFLRFTIISLGLAMVGHAQQTQSATFGNVIQLPGGTPSDVVLDQLRGRLYLVGNKTNQVLIFDYNANQIVGAIGVDRAPLAAAISMDNNWLYVTSSGASSLDVIDLSQNRMVQSVLLPSAPQGVEVGNDGRALVSMIGSGVVSGVPQGTLAVFDRTQTSAAQLQPVTVPALPTTPTPLPPTTLTRPTTTFTGKLLRTPDGSYIVGVITPVNSNTYVFVYEVGSGVVLRNRTISGQSTVLSMAPDGSRFMAGSTMFDIATLGIMAQENNANAPFSLTGSFSPTANIGGSIFTPDGASIYSAFNTATTSNPPPPANSSTLLINDPRNLAIRMGIRLPESIVAKMVMLADGSEAWGLSDSGLIHLPFAHLYDYPILAPETTQVFLSVDDCNHGLATGTLKINNLGKGKLTYTVGTNSAGAALVWNQSSGLAPGTVTFTMEPGRSGVTRQPGTNIWTGNGSSSGTPATIMLASPQAINFPPLVRVYMNYRQPDQRGLVYPVPTTPNNSPGGVFNPSGNEGLQDIVLDEPRGRLYITNSGYNRIEVFDLVKQHFVNPIPVGQLPHQMAMGTDGNTLYVGNTGGESIGIVDLNLGQVVDTVQFPPVPRNGTVRAIYPKTMAMGLFGLQFVMSDGSQWKLVGDQATVRPYNSVSCPTATSCVLNTSGGGVPISMLAAPDNSYILTLAGNGIAYLYESLDDTYISSRMLFPSPIRGYYGPLATGPDGSFYLANALVMNSALTIIGGSASPSATQTTRPPGGGPFTPPTVTVINTGNRNVAALTPLDANSYLQLTTPVRQNISTVTRDDSRTTLEMVNIVTGASALIGVVPENPVVSIFGTSRYNLNPRMMVVNSAGTMAYAITLSGLSVIPLAPSGSAGPAIADGGIVNATDGTQNIQPGSFITITGTNLASAAIADSVPPPTVLGGSCVTFGDIAVPLLSTSPGVIQAQVPDTLQPGAQVVEVRSLATAQDSSPVMLTVTSGN